MAIKYTYDINDFDFSLFKELSLEDGAATLAEFTALNIFTSIINFIRKGSKANSVNILICGGGRKNNFLVNRIKENVKYASKKKINLVTVKLIDEYGINGDFVESQAFGYLAIRSYLKLPISFPETTQCKKACSGGILIRNY